MNRRRKIAAGLLLFFTLAACMFAAKGFIWQPDEVDAQQKEKLDQDEDAVETVLQNGNERKVASQNAYRIILEQSSRQFRAGYAIDHSFLLWLESTYGKEVVLDLAYRVFEGQADVELWYELTGSSIHVLWLDYCRYMDYASYQFSNVTWKDSKDEGSIVLDFIGDINFGEGWVTTRTMDAQENGIRDCISADIIEEFQSADVFMLNNEFTFSSRGTALPGKAYTFRANPERVELLHMLGADIVSLANNHVFDFGEEALFDTMQTLSDAGILHIGAGADLDEAKEAEYFIINGKKIAIVTATQIERYSHYTQEATETSSGVLKTIDPAVFSQVIADAKRKSDYVIAYVHWGTEGQNKNEASQRALAEAFASAGADVIIGGHPHRMQGAEYINGVPVLYSLGNFWFSDGSLYTTIAQVKIDEDGNIGLRMIPCVQRDCVTSMITDADGRRAFYEYVADYSERIGITADGWIVDTSAAASGEELIYLSGQNYGFMSGGVDLDGRAIDIVGNLE